MTSGEAGGALSRQQGIPLGALSEEFKGQSITYCDGERDIPFIETI